MTTTCRKCSKSAPVLPFCSCGAIQDCPSGLEAFEIFGITPTPSSDSEALRSRFLIMTTKLHPDRFVTAPAPEPQYALRWSTAVNNAYQVLRDKTKRSLALLDHYGASPSHTNQCVPLELTELYFEAMDSEDPSAIGKEIESRRQLNLEQWDRIAHSWPEPEQLEQLKAAVESLQHNFVMRRYLDAMARDLAERSSIGVK